MAVLQNYTIKRNIYKGNKYSLMMYIPPMETIEISKSYTVNINPTLYLSLPYNNKISKDMQKTRSFGIKPYTIKSVLRTFLKALNWFYDEKYKDLYVMNDDGVLLFNAEFNSLSAKTKKRYTENTQLKIIPAIIEVAQGKYEESVVIFINILENRLELTFDEFETLCDMLEQFNFEQEVMLCYDLLRHSVNTGTLVSEVEYNKRRQNTGYYNK